MSKIADRIISIPNEISINYSDKKLTVSGLNGYLVQKIPNQVELIIENGTIKTEFILNQEITNKAILGTINSLINNMINGIKNPYQITLEIKGVGYKVSSDGKNLDFSLGYSHNILLEIPEEIKVNCLNNTKLVIEGIDKQKVGWFAAKIRDYRKPNVFVKSLKGIFYEGEKIKIKSGKKDAKK